MSQPTEIDFALIEMGDGASPTEVFTVLCGIQDVNVNNTANTSDRATYDCAKPAQPGTRRVLVNYNQLDITGNGLSNVATAAQLMAAVGKTKNYHVKCYARDGSDTGVLLSTYSGPFVLTANNITTTAAGRAAGSITLASNGTWTLALPS
jgi:hypothetical protein